MEVTLAKQESFIVQNTFAIVTFVKRTSPTSFKMHFFENTEVSSISNSMSNLFHSVMVDGKEEFGLFLKMVCMFFKREMYTHILSKIK